jgi:hypothetical protein
MKEWLQDSTFKMSRLLYEAEHLADEPPLRREIQQLLLRVLNAQRETLLFSHVPHVYRKKLVFIGRENTQTSYAEPFRWDCIAPERLLDASHRCLLHFSHSVEYIVLMPDVEEHHAALTACLNNVPILQLLVTNPEHLSEDRVVRRLNCELHFDLTADRIHGTKAERRKMSTEKSKLQKS